MSRAGGNDARVSGGLVPFTLRIVFVNAIAVSQSKQYYEPSEAACQHCNNTNITYYLESLAAETLYTLRPGSAIPEQGPPVKDSADIKLSQRVLVLGPGKSATINISATDPKGLDSSRLLVWSGWISINSLNSGLLTVPYLGLSGLFKEHQVLALQGVVGIKGTGSVALALATRVPMYQSPHHKCVLVRRWVRIRHATDSLWADFYAL